MAILEVYKENKLLGSFRLDEDFVSIGRAGSNEIVLPDRELKVSRYHAVLIKNPYDPPGYILRDLSSSWGTKIGKEFIFQTPLKDGDIIDIANFRLKYVATGEKTQEPFMIISDSREMEPITLPSDIGDQETHHGERNCFSQGIKDLLEGLICGLPASIRNLYEEMLGRVATAAKVEEVIDNAMPLLFYTLNMKEGCSGCFVVFEGEEKFRYLGAKCMVGRFSIPVSRQVIEEIHGGH